MIATRLLAGCSVTVSVTIKVLALYVQEKGAQKAAEQRSSSARQQKMQAWEKSLMRMRKQLQLHSPGKRERKKPASRTELAGVFRSSAAILMCNH